VKLTFRLFQALLLLGVLVIVDACKKPPVTAEDVRVGRQAMPIRDVSLMLRSGSRQNEIIAEVNRRKIPQKISAALQVELESKGASSALIAALGDKENILTENQKAAFDEQMDGGATLVRQSSGNQEGATSAQSNAEQQERNRLLDLQQENFRNIERNQALQMDKEQAQVNSRYRLEPGGYSGNSSRVYATPSRRIYATPSRRD
jgi:hypothetical protein